MTPALRAPAPLRVATWAVVALILGLLAVEVLWLRPGYAFGDETIEVGMLQALREGVPLPWLMGQGSVHRALLYAWVSLAGTRLAVLHVPALAIITAETAALFFLARRWADEETACWAVLADLVAAATWLRVRSLLSFQLLPLELLLLGLAAGRVKGPRAALAWGAVAGLLCLDYEGMLVAGPLLLLTCLWREPEFRRQAGWVAAGGLASLGAIVARQHASLAAYVNLRHQVTLGTDDGRLLRTALRNLGQIFTGGEPLPYFGIRDWPAIPFWAWPGLGLGLLAARRRGLGALILWAVAAMVATQATLAPYGVPAHRLVAAWPALCLLTGLGFTHLRRQAPRLGAGLAGVLLMFGLATELHGYVLHMARNGMSFCGRSQAVEAAAEEAALLARRDGAAVLTRLADWRNPVIPFHLAGRGIPAPRPGGDAVIFLDPEFRLAVQALPLRVKVVLLGRGQEPVLLALATGPMAARFKAIEAALMEARGDEHATAAAQRASIEAWMRGHPKADPFVWTSLAHRDAAISFEADGISDSQAKVLLSRPFISPGPYAKLSQYYAVQAPELSLRLAHLAQGIDPLYGPGYIQEAEAYRQLGKLDEAAAVKARWKELYNQGAWYIGN